MLKSQILCSMSGINSIIPVPIKLAPYSYADILKKGVVLTKSKNEVKMSHSDILPHTSCLIASPSQDSRSRSSSTTASNISSDSDYNSDLDLDLDQLCLAKSTIYKQSHIDEADFLNPNWRLPGGKKYQQDGARLENAFFNSLPTKIKNNISTNVTPKTSAGNIIVEFDMVYQSDSSKRIIAFEIKGVNPYTINNLDRQEKLLAQGIRQKKYLEYNFPHYKIDCVYCFVTGKIRHETLEEFSSFSDFDSDSDFEWKTVAISKHKSILDHEFVKNIKSNGVKVAIGESPQQCAKNALLMLNLLK